jgi:hypothetical protein
MATTESTTPNVTNKPTCPVCHQSDQVMTMEHAYDSGVARTAPPDMPTKNVPMMKYILTSAVLVGIFVFLVIVLIGSEVLQNVYIEVVLVVLTLISIISALVTSYVAFQRVVKGDAEATERFPAWDRAMAAWKLLDYCKRDDVVFDPRNNKVITNEALAALRSMEEGTAEQVATTLVK